MYAAHLDIFQGEYIDELEVRLIESNLPEGMSFDWVKIISISNTK